ncbi:MAG: HIT domain-containing protein [Pyrinomonadaceae bacterium]
MDILWSPWRYSYIKSEEKPVHDCVFCGIANSPADDEANFVLHRAGRNFVILNIYPYISGHLMVVPYRHLSLLSSSTDEESVEHFDLVKKAEKVIGEVYQPDGINIGMNLGKAAGAGVAGHFHAHVLPRWVGDANFMTAIGQTRTIPEALTDTFDKLKGRF